MSFPVILTKSWNAEFSRYISHVIFLYEMPIMLFDS